MPEAAVAEALAAAAHELSASGADTPRLDAEVLLAEALGVSRARLVIDAAVPLAPEARARFDALVARRRAREPVAYIVGRRDFRHISLAVDRRALIPRPETELLVEVGLELPRGARVLDVGTGSGAVALALKHERPDLDVWASDVKADALALARANAQALGLEVHVRHGDLLAAAPARLDAVLANLPYVAEGAALAPEIALYEPPGALFGGRDGLDVVRRLVGAAGAIAVLALEIGSDQADAVAALLADGGFAAVARRRDLAGHERVLVGRR